MAQSYREYEPEPGVRVVQFDTYEAKPRIHVVEFVKLRSFGMTCAFMRLSMRIYRYARESPGYYAGGIRGQWWRRRFYAYTVWEDRDAMLRFVHTGPHANAVARMPEFAAPGSCYAEFVSEDPPDWEVAERYLETPTRYFVPPEIGGSLR